MSLGISIRENGSGLSSDRATERKKCAEALKTLLSGNAAPALLTENTLKKKGCTWDELFADIHEYILKEIEKFESSKTFEGVIKPLATSLLHAVVTGAKKGKAYIKSDQITSACLFILKNQRMTKAIGDAYLNLLYKYVVSCDHYVDNISPQTWEDLLDVTLTACGSKYSKLDYFTRLRLVLLIMQSGSNSCQFVGPLRDMVPRLLKLFQTQGNDKKVQEVVLEITLHLLHYLHLEYRLTMCEFTENMLHTIMSFYDQNSEKKKGMIFQLLNIIVKIHHPEGKLQNEEGSLAFNWDNWNKHLNTIVELISVEVKVLQKLFDTKFRFKEAITLKDCCEFFALAASVFHQIFNKPMQNAETENGSANKRQKLTSNQITGVHHLIDELRQNQMPWLGIVTIFVKNFGNNISEIEYTSLLLILDSLVTNSLQSEMLEELACHVIRHLSTNKEQKTAACDNALRSLWNSCVRHSTASDGVHKALHGILQTLLQAEVVTYQVVQPLMKLYTDKAMPVTDESMNTLSYILHLFYSKYNNPTTMQHCLAWFIENEITCTNMLNVQDLLLRLIANENVDLTLMCKQTHKDHTLHDILLDIDKSLLYNQFEYEMPKLASAKKNAFKRIERNCDSERLVRDGLKLKLEEQSEKFTSKQIKPIEFTQHVRITFSYCDMILKYTNMVDGSQINVDPIYAVMGSSLKLLFASLTEMLKNCKENAEEVKLLNNVTSLLKANSDSSLISVCRQMDKDFFHSVHKVINNIGNKHNDEEGMDSDDVDTDSMDMRYSCIHLLAAYCRSNAQYKEDIVDFILDPKLYNFLLWEDIECVFVCIYMLIDTSVENPPLEMIFAIMQQMCKLKFRNSKAIGGLFKILMQMLDSLWSHPSPTMKANCRVMVSSCLIRCKSLYYPPHVAALIYECVARVEQLSRQHGQASDSTLRESLLSATASNTHAIRLHCSHLLKTLASDYKISDVQAYVTLSLEIFIIDACDKSEAMLKDELENRTLTVLHTFYTIAQTRNTLISCVINAIMKILKEKMLDKKMVKKVLDKIADIISVKGIDTYLNSNILALLHYWFSEKYKLEDLPVYLLGFRSTDSFLENNIKWVVPAEILWQKNGNIQDSEILKKLQRTANKSPESVIEECFRNIIVLCIPYVVIEKYGLDCGHKENEAKNANTLFQLTRQVLGTEKWSSLFAEGMGELVLLTTTHLADSSEVKNIFDLDIPQPMESYYYPKEVYLAILRYFGIMINEDIMRYLCKNQAMMTSKIILKSWDNVLQKTFLEKKAVCLQKYITLIETLPLGFDCDHFVCNFSCKGLLHAIKASKNQEELRVFIRALEKLLAYFLPSKVDILRETLPLAVSVLTVKKEEGYVSECGALLDYLVEGADNVDGAMMLSQHASKISKCSTKTEFNENLKIYIANLSCPSLEVLCNLKQFLTSNRGFVSSLGNDLSVKGFSEDCKTSLLHQVVNVLNKIMTSDADEKTVIEACNCLTEIRTYDLKTLVMAAPSDSDNVTGMKPPQYFAFVVMNSLSQMLFDENTLFVGKVMSALARLLKFKEGKIAFDLGEVDQEILKQFLPGGSTLFQARFQVDEARFAQHCRENVWIPTDSEDYLQWLSRLSTALLNIVASRENYLPHLAAVTKLKPMFSRSILPALVGLILSAANDDQIKMIGAQVNGFLNHFLSKTFNCSSSESDSLTNGAKHFDHNQKVIIQDVLNVVNFVRLQRIHYKQRPSEMESLNYLNLEYDLVAWAATVADGSMTGLYYGELWAAARNQGVPPSSPDAMARLDGGENMQNIFRKCFISIGEMDAVDGCGGGHLTSEAEKRKHLMNTGQYSDALLCYDIALSHGAESPDETSLQYGVVMSLHQSGMHHLALQYIKSLPENEQLTDVKYDCLSSLGDWSVFVDTRETEAKLKDHKVNVTSVLKELRYACLKDCLNLQSSAPDFAKKLVEPLNRAKLTVAKLCEKLNMDNCQNVYTVLSQLHMFSDIEDYFAVRSNQLAITSLLDKWQVDKVAPYQDFKHVEALVMQRSLILEHASKAYGNLLNEVVDTQLRYAELGLSNQRIQLSQRLLAMAKSSVSSGEVALVEGQIAWAKGHTEISLSLLRSFMYNESQDAKLTAAALRQYGTWMAESKCENARDIIDKYLKRSLDSLGGSGRADVRLKIYHDIAKFADAEYKQVVSYMKSSIFENKVKCMENMKGAASSLRSTQQTLTREEKKALMTNEKLSILDEAEIKSTIAEKTRFLELAMRYYLLSLKEGEENNLSVFRVISLWFDNPALEFQQKDAETFAGLLAAVPSRKYVPVLPQLAPRLGDDKQTFANNLNSILVRCSKEHPHHTLPILFGLKNCDKDKYLAASQPRTRPVTEEPRTAAAASLVNDLVLADRGLGRLVAQMERMCDALISFANFKSPSKDTRQSVPKSELIGKLNNLTEVPIPTITLPVRHDCTYTEFPAIVSFAQTFELVGGVNCPKKMTCKGSDGKHWTLLIKGEDDLRQDAVMQQVFNIVNTLLEINTVTSRHKLLIRTYKVVPLSHCSGVLEWCEGTVPIGGYLIGHGSAKGGAHSRYRPQDISHSAARAKIQQMQGRSNAEKLAVFQRILREFKPVFQYFFTEHYLDPVTWYERRLAYTKSVATSSMVGYIMGLGDRHVQNILIDKYSAEVVHIDFGIAFDQGKALPTPETVPFRLTQDIIAGFGSSGVEGIFRRCCEKTMQLLRDNREALLTTLEVLLCDPLYSWSLTPAVAERKQNMPAPSTAFQTSGQPGGGGLAERALLAVSCKLSGTEGGLAGGVAVAGQVARLVRTATDPANLSRLFHGWQPYL